MHRRRPNLACIYAAAAVVLAVTMGPVSAAGAASGVRAVGDSWPMFNHDPLHSGVSPDTSIGASTAPGLTKLWSKRLKSVHDQASPAVAFNASRKEMVTGQVA